uniref:DUF5641 domain-containing protein n=1 Tax=Heliothis virescens TaxID=7102 RepID=A0A2A4JSA9_HELVI
MTEMMTCMPTKKDRKIKMNSFKINDIVLYKKFVNKLKYTWCKGVVLRRMGKVLYLVKDIRSSESCKRHVNQLMLYKGTINGNGVDTGHLTVNLPGLPTSAPSSPPPSPPPSPLPSSSPRPPSPTRSTPSPHPLSASEGSPDLTERSQIGSRREEVFEPRAEDETNDENESQSSSEENFQEAEATNVVETPPRMVLRKNPTRNKKYF